MVYESRRVKQSGLNVGGFKEGMISQDLFVRSAGGKQFEQIHHTEAHAPDAGASAALVRVEGNAIE